ncbi:MAG: hypothetical protein R2824_28340 [Saprospiraceae bacterium]|nr:hypothetical protein [Lewinella sp.]
MSSMYEVLTMLALFAAVVIVIYILARYTYLTKKIMAENGAYAPGATFERFRYLEIGCIIFGLGVGLGLSSVFTLMDLGEDTMDLLIYGTILIFGGLGLAAAHFIRDRSS